LFFLASSITESATAGAFYRFRNRLIFVSADEELWGGVDASLDVTLVEVNFDVADVDSEDALDLDSSSEVGVCLGDVLVDIGLELGDELVSRETKCRLEVRNLTH